MALTVFCLTVHLGRQSGISMHITLLTTWISISFPSQGGRSGKSKDHLFHWSWAGWSWPVGESACCESPATPLPEPQGNLLGQGFTEPDPTEPCEQQRRHSGPWPPDFSICIRGGGCSGTSSLACSAHRGRQGELPLPGTCCLLAGVWQWGVWLPDSHRVDQHGLGASVSAQEACPWQSPPAHRWLPGARWAGPAGAGRIGSWSAPSCPGSNPAMDSSAVLGLNSGRWWPHILGPPSQLGYRPAGWPHRRKGRGQGWHWSVGWGGDSWVVS